MAELYIHVGNSKTFARDFLFDQVVKLDTIPPIGQIPFAVRTFGSFRLSGCQGPNEKA